MWRCTIIKIFVILFCYASAQTPPRFQIPGAILVQGSRSGPLRQQRLNALNTEFLPRPRRPQQSPSGLRDIRPVIEEEADYPSSPGPSISSFDAEVNKLSIPAINSAITQAEDEDIQQPLKPSPTPFRPEKAVPITRDQIRERTISETHRPIAISRPLPLVRQESKPLTRPTRPVIRQDLDDEEENIPRQPIRPKVRPQNVPFQAAQYRPSPRPKQHLENDDIDRKRQPVAQILRKYRTDNDDGSITWGFENDDGTFKEETLGTDCVISGKYGYVDPDGVKREFSYEAGNKCDPNQLAEDELEEELAPRNPPPPRKQLKPVPSKSQQGPPQIQYRPQLAQY